MPVLSVATLYTPAHRRSTSDRPPGERMSQVLNTSQWSEVIERYLDRRYLVDVLSRLARVPTDVPLGYETLIEPDHPKLVHYVQAVVRPALIGLGIYDLLDVPRNNLVVQLGANESGQALLVQNYTPA